MSQDRDQEILEALKWGTPRDEARIDRMVEKLSRLWKAWPDLRLGQLVDGVAYRAQATSHDDAVSQFYFEDDKMESALDKELAMAGLAKP